MNSTTFSFSLSLAGSLGRAARRSALTTAMLVLTSGVQAGSLEDLIDAGDKRALQTYLKDNPKSIHQHEDSGVLPLTYAVQTGDLALVKVLVKQGGDINAVSTKGRTVLQEAILSGNTEVARWLIKKGVDITTTNTDGQTPLHWAAQRGDVALCKWLLSKKVSPLQLDLQGRSAFDMAIGEGRWDALNLLLDATPAPTVASRESISEPTLNDDRIRYWSALYWAGRDQALFESLEQDLVSDHAQSYAAYIWSSVHNRFDRLQQAYSQASPALKSGLGETPKVLLSIAQTPLTALTQHPAQSISKSNISALIDLAHEAEEQKNFTAMYDYLERGVELAPNLWQFAWMYEEMPALARKDLKSRAEAFSQRPEIKETLTGQYIQSLVQQTQWKGADRLPHIEKYLERDPFDARALSAKAYALDGNAYYEQASTAALKAMVQYPFYANRDKAVELLIENREQDQAKRLVLGVARWFGMDSAEPRSVRYYAEGLIDSGDRGAGRRELDKGLKAHPQDGRLWMTLARLELLDKRPEEAVFSAQKGVELLMSQSTEELSEGHLKRLLESHRDNDDLISAVEAFSQYQQQLPKVSPSMYSAVLADLKELGRDQELESLLSIARDKYPLDLSLALTQIERDWSKGQKPQALTQAMDWLPSYPSDNRLLTLVHDYTAELHGKSKAQEFVIQHRQERPWVKTLWQLSAATLENGSDTETKANFWRQAISAAPTESFACEKVIDLYVDDKQWDKALQQSQTCLTDMSDTENVRISARQIMWLNQGWILERQSKSQRISADKVKTIELSLEHFLESKGARSSYLRYREALCVAKNDRACAADALAKRSYFSRDSTSMFHDLVADYSGELGLAQTFGYGSTMLERRPYDTRPVISFVHKHLLWGGSAIVALKAIHEAQARGLNIEKSWERQALGKLGDSLSEFERYSMLNKYPGESKRYVNWFDHARTSALEADGTQVFYRWDGEQPEVEILLPSGELIRRKDHPRFGRPTYFSRGATFIRLEYTDSGQLRSIENSNGKRIELQYNREDQIQRLISDDEDTIIFTYNSFGKPGKIEYQGLGVLDVTYDEHGEVLSVDSEQGHQMALRITSTFQKLLGMVNQVKKIRDLKNLPELEVNDAHLDSLRAVYQETPSDSKEEQVAALELAEYLVAHQGYGPDVFDEAEGMLFHVVAFVQQYDDSKKSRENAAQAVGLLYDLYREVRPQGLAEESFTYWSEAYRWLRGETLKKSTSTVTRALKKIDQEPLVLLRDAHRLQRSDFSNSAYWKRYGNEELLGPQLASAEKSRVLLRRNGDLVLATDKGLSVLSDGFWQWYGYDRSSRRFSANLDPLDLGDRSTVLSLAETNDGVLWLGTPKGLMAVSGDYDGEIKSWGANQGLASTRVNALASAGSRISIATPKGLLHGKYSSTQLRVEANAKNKNIEQVITLSGDYDSVIYRSGRELYLVSDGLTTELGVGEKMAFMSDMETLYWLNQGVIYEQTLVADEGRWSPQESSVQVVAGQASLLMSKRIHELAIWRVEDNEQTLVVNTDTAINVLTGSYFEAMALPLEAGRGGLQVGPRVSVSNDQGVALISDDGVYTRLKSKVEHIVGDAVFDLHSDDKLAVTYMAMGDHIRILPHELPLEASEYFSSVNARHLAQDAKGNLISHDGRSVLRFKRGSDQPQELFRAEPSAEKKGWKGGIVDILVDSRDDIWVAAGSSLFRYHGEQMTEFNYILDSDQFPSRSSMLMSVYETLSGEIQVVASDESHLKYKGVDLEGGLLQWNGKGFDDIGKPDHWFATAYTAIDDSTAVISTNHHFAREMAGAEAAQQRQSYIELKDPSYTALKKKTKMLFLGSEGKRLGRDEENSNTWLFPSAGGLVLYHNGRWIYPDRLNQLLPQDQALGQYGGRTVHAVEVDPRGRIYAATDLGLMLYQSHGVASLLTDNQLGQVAFSDSDFGQQQALSEIFLSSLPSDSKSGQLLKRYQDAQTTIDDLQAQLTQQQGVQTGDLASDSVAASSTQSRDSAVGKERDTSASEKLQRQLKQKSRVREKLLARMETEHYGLYQMLKLDPREVAAMHKRLTPDQALLQFLPTPDKLLIQLVTQQGAQIREVAVSREDLEAVTALVVKGLRHRAAHLTTDSARGLSAKGDGIGADQPQALQQHLAWLYEKLLRPVERELSGKSQVFVTPVGALTYLPFPALIRQSDPVLEYAAQRFNIGVIPSMYHLSLVLQQNDSYSDGITMVADPDGSLPGARNEVARIAQSSNTESTILEGAEATYQNLSNSVDEARILHLATHGTLDPNNPSDSFLLLADNYRLNVIDIATLDLDQTDLVVLSACETGIGKPGLEYATLARAFALASVPTVVASYWKVDDGATANLMQAFYDSVENEHDNDYLAAMSAAQRRLIDTGGLYAEPAAWAGFTVFGKP